MLCRAKPVAALILGDGKLFLCIIALHMVPEFVVHKITNVRGGYKWNFMKRVVSIERFIQILRYTNPMQNVIQPHIAGSTGLVMYCFVHLGYVVGDAAQ